MNSTCWSKYYIEMILIVLILQGIDALESKTVSCYFMMQGKSLKGLNKNDCDERFRKNMLDICNSAYPGRTSFVKLVICIFKARPAYYSKARKEGEKYYQEQPANVCSPLYGHCLK